MKKIMNKLSFAKFFLLVIFSLGCSFNRADQAAYDSYNYYEEKYSEMSKEYSEMSKKYSSSESELEVVKNKFATVDKSLNEQETNFNNLLQKKEKAYSELQDSFKANAMKGSSTKAFFNTKIKETNEMIFTNTHGPISFYCPEKMKEEVTYEVRAMLGTLIDKKELETELLKTINETRQERNEPPISNTAIKTKDVYLGIYLKIELKDDAGNKFNIIIPSEKQKKDSLIKIFNEVTNEFFDKTFQWSWKVTPKANTRGEASLTLVVTPYDKNMNPLDGKNKEYKIKIVLKESFFTAFWDKVNRNPEWTFASIIAPVISFFAGFLLRRKKDKTNLNG
ncbi:MAG: hypothetical protein A2X64_08280 [Ignavibacteria bacterium GWF2_33_9]|nr:MAG: hypothetical protein A2X64_08280 [Ignavibacteria bacterium GWF2_33_9]